MIVLQQQGKGSISRENLMIAVMDIAQSPEILKVSVVILQLVR